MTPAEFATIRRSVGLCADCGRDAENASRCPRHLKTHRAKERIRRRDKRLSDRLATPVQSRLDEALAFIVAFYRENGRAPTTRDVGEAMGITNQGVAKHVQRLAADGLVFRGALTRRGHRISLTRRPA